MDSADSSSRLLASVLAGSWRQFPPAPTLTGNQLEQLTPVLLKSGASGLGWWAVQNSTLRFSPAAIELHHAYRLLSLEHVRHEQRIEVVLGLFQSEGVDPILAKGWAASRLYPEPALRPYGDIDLCVRPIDYSRAADLLKHPDLKGYRVDLHKSFTEISNRCVDELYERSVLVKLKKDEVRVLCPEDHLALLAAHWLKHGAWRPVGLCGIGVAIEKRHLDFDWSICLGTDARKAKWIRCVIGLANSLLGARIEDTPVANGVRDIPRWLTRSVLKAWRRPYAGEQAPMKHPIPMKQQLRLPAGLLSALKARWPNPIKATVDMNWPLNDVPRLPFQLGYCFSRAKKFLR